MQDRNLKFLVIDDFSPVRKVIKNSLNKLGYDNVTLATNGLEGKKLIIEKKFDCIISDWNMPVMTGIELLQFVRSTPKHSQLKFMLVTAEIERHMVVQAIESGVSEFLIKPFSVTTFQAKLKQALKQKKHKLINPVDVNSESSTVSKLSPKKESTSNVKSTILIVDDEATNIDVLAGILKDTYQIKLALNGEKALKIASGATPPDLILLDIMMPQMDGIEVCIRLKEDPATQDIPVIFLTAKSEVDDITTGFEVGAVDYVVKPAIPAVLKARVKTHLKIKKARDQLVDQVDTLVENSKLRADIERMTQHDLKNPLSAVISESELLIEDKWIGVDQKKQVQNILTSGYSILNLINRSLDMYKIETDAYTLNAVKTDISDVCNNVVMQTRAICVSEKIHITYKAEEIYLALAEELLTFSLVSNLIRNAVDASKSGDTVHVEIDQDDNHVNIKIHNSQVIPSDIRESFFEKYATSGKKTGTGLGTYSAKLMTDIQNGSIDFVSDSSLGTTLTVKLPRFKES